jgi:hypothetical protein
MNLASGDIFVGLTNGISTMGELSFTHNSSWTCSHDSAIQQNIWIYWPSYSQTMQILGSGMSTKMWEVTVEHSKTCILTDKVHLYYPHSLIKTAVVFNVVGEVRGLISEKFVCADDLMEKDKAEAHAAVKQAYENWKNVYSPITMKQHFHQIIHSSSM